MKNFSIQGMTCSSCVRHVEKAIKAVPGVVQVQVNLMTNHAQVQTNASYSEGAVERAVASVGYKASSEDQEEEARIQPWQLGTALAIAAILMLPMMSAVHIPSIMQFALASIVQWYFGAIFYRSAWKKIIHGSVNMDSLVTLGSFGAYFLSSYMLYQHWQHPEHLHYYFESSATIIAFIMMGKFLEEKTKLQSRSALSILKQSLPQAIEVQRNKDMLLVSLEQVLPGDRFKVAAGHVVPVDGVVEQGSASMDTSAVNGEIKPAFISAGDKVLQGMINLDGLLTIQATKASAQSLTSMIVSHLETQQQLPSTRLVDKIAAVFVPAIIVLSILTGIAWWIFTGQAEQSILNAIAVIVIACPCALGLATPSALFAANTLFAKNAMLLKNTAIFDNVTDIKRIAFDKTGTLTQHQLSVTQAHSSEPRIAGIVLALEAHHHHPIAQALVAFYKGHEPLMATEVQVVPGLGIQGLIEGQTFIIGNDKFMELNHIKPQHENTAMVYVANKGSQEIIATFNLEHKVRDDAKELMDNLHKRNIETVMITGDSSPNTYAVARELDMDDVFAGVSPVQKAEIIEQLGPHTMYIGDGINDVVAMNNASVSIAMNNAADTSKAQADIILLNDKISLVEKVVRFIQKTRGIIHQNLFWAFFYNILFIPLAMLGMLSPTWAALAMSASSVIVVANSLRLLKAR